jgi:hypothetical protein
LHQDTPRSSVALAFPARLVATVVGFPKKTQQSDMPVRFSVTAGIDTRTRTFDGRVFRSRQCAGHGRDAHLLAEDFGAFRILMALVRESRRLRLVVRGWRFVCVPLPRSPARVAISTKRSATAASTFTSRSRCR